MAVDGGNGSVESVLDTVNKDGWENIITGHGTTRDKRTYGQIKAISSSARRQEFEDLYHGDDMAAKIADMLPGDATRKWISMTVDPEQTEREPQKATELADNVLQALSELGAQKAYRDAPIWARVYGGGAIFVGADDGGGENADLSQPLNPDRIRKITYLEVYDRHELMIETEYADPSKPEKFGKPETYRLMTTLGTKGGTVIPNVIIHETRLIRFDGALTSRQRQIRNAGWSDSVYMRIEEVLRDFGISWASAANLLTDFAPSIFKMKNLAQAIGTDAEGNVLTRMGIMDQCRSTIRMIPIDADNEDYSRSATPMTGLPELLSQFALRLASAARMPVSILFGQSPSGLSNTAEGDLTIWYDSVESYQENELRPKLHYLIDLLLRSAEGPTRGRVPEGWGFTFNPLWQESQEEQTKSRKTQAEADAIYIDTGVLDPNEVALSRFGGEAYSYETQINKEARAQGAFDGGEVE